WEDGEPIVRRQIARTLQRLCYCLHRGDSRGALFRSRGRAFSSLGLGGGLIAELALRSDERLVISAPRAEAHAELREDRSEGAATGRVLVVQRLGRVACELGQLSGGNEIGLHESPPGQWR